MPLRSNAKIEVLKSVPLFAGCSRAELARIAHVADETEVPAGTELMTEGTQGQQFCAILEGTVRVTRGGRKLRDCGPGEYIGDVALVTGLPRIATGRAITDVRILVITAADFRALIMQTPSVAVKVLKSVGERLHDASI